MENGELKETILSLKAEIEGHLKNAEPYIKLMKEVEKRVNALGFKVYINPDSTVYIFRDTREGYGEPLKVAPGGVN